MLRSYKSSIGIAAALILMFAFGACGGGSSDDITLSGIVTDTESASVSGVTVTLMDGATGVSMGVSDVSAGDGSYTLVGIPSGEPFYLNMTATGYVPTNTQIHTLTSSEDEAEVMIVDLDTANTLAPLVYIGKNWTNIAGFAGLIGVDLYDTFADDAGGYSLTPSPALDQLRYNDGDGTFDGGDSYTHVRTSGGGPMILGYAATNVDSIFSFDAQGCTTVYSEDAWIKTGQVTIIIFWELEDAC